MTTHAKIHILLADDDRFFRSAVAKMVAPYGVITQAESEAQAKDYLAKGAFDLAILDLQMENPNSGHNLLKITQTRGIPSIMLSSYDSDESTLEAYQLGCQHYLMKRQFRKSLIPYIESILRQNDANSLEQIFKNSFVTVNKELRSQIEELAQINGKGKCVFLSGETGVGKTRFAKLIHKFYHKESDPFIHINCAEIPEELIESELFGHTAGAFTGAKENKKGKLELANNGILFLDEIATMSNSMQKKLLKAIEEKEFYPLGSEKVVKSEFTLVSATCEDLFKAISEDRFRKDLFFRISGLNLDIPSLSDRKEDIRPLIKSILKNQERRIVLTEDALEFLEHYSWPGNIRQLIKVIEGLSLKNKGIIGRAEVTQALKNVPTQPEANTSSESEWMTPFQKNFIKQKGLKAFVNSIEEQIVTEVLNENNGKVGPTIKNLGLSASAFYRIQNNIAKKTSVWQ